MVLPTLRRLLAGRTPRRPETRLTEAEALAVARGVLGETVGLRVADIVRTSSGLEWQIATVTIGSGEFVHVSDATGEIATRRRWGRR